MFTAISFAWSLDLELARREAGSLTRDIMGVSGSVLPERYLTSGMLFFLDLWEFYEPDIMKF